MDTVILTPYRATAGRDANWRFVQQWIADHYPMPVYVGDHDGSFSPSRARDDAARQAGGWDVAVFHDADTIAHPDAITQAISMAADSMQMVVAGDKHMYCTPESSQQVMASMSLDPAQPDDDGRGLYERPCSGVFAVSRQLWEATGGYVASLHGYGYEDLVFLQQCGIFGRGNTWVPNHTTHHMWHPPAERTNDTKNNKRVWRQLTRYRVARDRNGARQYLASLGHKVPA